MQTLVFLAAQDEGPLYAYDWDLDRHAYIQLLGQYDLTRNAASLVEFVCVIELTEDV